jgi:hypothetical protein
MREGEKIIPTETFMVFQKVLVTCKASYVWQTKTHSPYGTSIYLHTFYPFDSFLHREIELQQHRTVFSHFRPRQEKIAMHP